MRKKLLVLIFILAMVTVLLLALPTVADASSVDSPTYSNQAREMLSEYDKALYDQLFTKISALKNSDGVQYTRFNIDLTALGGAKYQWSASELPSLLSGTTVKDAFLAQFDFEKVLTALTHDMPLEMYWYNKTSTGGTKTLLSHDGSNITNYIVCMQATTMHQGTPYSDEYPTVTGVKTTYENTYENAIQFVRKYEGKSDFAKIKGYVEEICNLVSYDNTVGASTPYSDIWQPTYVFDGDKSTNVVCEGYSKAFQLLCNLSAFSDTTCYTVSGYTNSENPPTSTSGGHMWNIVKIDGLSYVVDVTNSEDGSVGQGDELILNAPDSGSYDTHYFFNAQGKLYYSYASWTKSLWGESLLTLSISDYTVPPVNFTLTSNEIDGCLVYNGEDITIGANVSSDIYYSLDDGNVDDYNWSISYYLDDNGKIGSTVSSIRDVGVYWIKVKATKYVDVTITGSATIKVRITPKPVTLSSLIVSQKTYDKSTSVTLVSAVLNGIVGSDDVRLSTQSTLSLPEANVGEYNFVYPTNLILEGTNKDNYTLAYKSSDVIPLSTPTTVAKRTINTSLPIFEYAIVDTTFEQFDFTVTGLYDGDVERGTIRWYDGSNDEIIDMTTSIIRGEVYTWKLIFDDTNFNSVTGTIEIYPDDELYKVTATTDGTTKGSVSCSRQNYLQGETVTVVATPKDGYAFDCWVVNGEEVSSDSTYTFTVASDVTVEAKFKIAPTTQSGGADDTALLNKVLDVLKILIPYLPYILIGGGVLGLIILILLYAKISKSAKRKKRLKNLNK